MANTATPRSARYRGIFFDGVNNQLKIYRSGTLVATLSNNDATFADAVTATGTITGGTMTTGGVLTGNSLAVVTGAVSIDEIAYTFPATDGSNTNQLTTNGSGVLAWLPADDGAA